MGTSAKRDCATVRGIAFSEDKYPEKALTEKIIGCAINVHRELGPGYLESIYENALAHEFAKQGLNFETQRLVKVFYDSVEVGVHRVDVLVEGKVVLELKSVDTLTQKHVAQMISTLKAVGARVGLLMNFDETRLVDGIRRVVF